MWWRALLGSRDDAVRVATLVAAAVAGLVLVLAGTLGWSAGLATGVMVAGSAVLVFRWRRRCNERLVARLALDLVQEAESELRRRSRRPPDTAPGA